MLKKIFMPAFKLSLLAVLVLVLSACAGDGAGKKTSEDNRANLNYQNKSLDFELELPEVIDFYTTQRKENDNFTDIEFFVPTSDTEYSSQVRNYARPLVVRVFQGSNKEDIGEDNIYKIVGEKGDKIYTLRFWQDLPQDWQEKWSKEIEEGIINSFKTK